MRLRIDFKGSEKELIEIAEQILGHELESRDLGDAMGVFISEAMENDSEFTCDHKVTGNTLMAWIEYDLFEWDGIDPNFKFLPHSE